MREELKRSITAWWAALRTFHGVANPELADIVEARARRGGARHVQEVDRKVIANWISRGTFPPSDTALQAAVRDLMHEMATKQGPPAGAGRWTTAESLLQGWKTSRQSIPTTRHPKSLQADTRRITDLEDVLVDGADRTVAMAASPEGLVGGFWQGSWLTGGEAPPYVPRAIDDDLDARIRALADKGEGGLVLIVGAPKSGKTRSLLESLRRVVPDRTLWRLSAVDGALDAAIAAVEPDGGRSATFNAHEVVVMLDDLQRHRFGGGAINDRIVRQAMSRGLLIVGTLHLKDLVQWEASFTDHTGPASAQQVSPAFLRLVLDARVNLNSQLTTEELEQASGELVAQAALHDVDQSHFARLPELLAAVDTLHNRALVGINDTDRPEIAAIIMAALDAHYFYPAGVSLERLADLTQWAFQHVHPTRVWDPFLFSKALDWATTPLGGPGSHHAIVHAVAATDPLLILFDPLKDRLHAVWEPHHLTPHLSHLDADLIGTRAEFLGDRALSTVWWTAAAERGDLESIVFLAMGSWETSPQAALDWCIRGLELSPWETRLQFVLYWLLDEANDPAMISRIVAEAHKRCSMPRSFIASAYFRLGDRQAAARELTAGANLGELRCMSECYLRVKELNDREAEIEWWAFRVQFMDAQFADAQKILATAWEGPTQLGLRPAIRYAKGGSRSAMLMVASRLEQRGRAAQAAKWRRRAEAPTEPRFRFALGLHHLRNGELELAQKWLTLALDGGPAQTSTLLGDVYLKLGHPDLALESWVRAIDLGDMGGWISLGRWYLESGDLENAKSSFERASSFDATVGLAERPSYRGVGLISLGAIHHKLGDLAAARQAFESASEAGWFYAHYFLGKLDEDAGDPEAAFTHYKLAARVNAPETLFALARMAVLVEDRGMALRACAALETSEYPEMALKARLLVAWIEDREEDALQVLHDSAAGNHLWAMDVLARHYELKEDPDTAIHWADMAALRRLLEDPD